jgi:large subunit ribosomal protein L10
MPLKYAKKRIGKAPKQTPVEKLLGALKAADSVVVADLQTLKVADLSKLRTDLRQKGARLIVARNTLVQIALKEAGYPSLDPLLKGPTALAFGVGDPAVPARVLLDLSRKTKP